MFKKKQKKEKEERLLDRKKRKTLKQRLKAMTYIQAALSLFVLSILLFLFCMWRSIATAGGAGLLIAFFGILSFIAALAGLIVTVYGHFFVRIEGKIKWIAGLATNGMMMVIMLMLYLVGIG